METPPLPPPTDLRRRAIALATLEAALSPDWADRWFSWIPDWAPGQEVLEGRDGGGQHLLVLLTTGEAALNLSSSEHGLLEPSFGGSDWAAAFFATEPVPSRGSTVRAHTVDGAWTEIEATPGSSEVAREWFSFLTEGPERYLEFAADYYELELTPEVERVVRDVLGGRPLSPDTAAVLAPENDWALIAPELESMGIPAQES